MSTHNMFSWRNKKNIMWIPFLICSYENGCRLSPSEASLYLPQDIHVLILRVNTVVAFLVKIMTGLSLLKFSFSFQIYDWSIIYRSCLIAGCALFLVIGMIAYLIIHVMEPIYAKPIRKLR